MRLFLLAASAALCLAGPAAAQERPAPAAPGARGLLNGTVHVAAGVLVVSNDARLITPYNLTADSADGLSVEDGELVFTGGADQLFTTDTSRQFVRDLTLAKTAGAVVLGMDLAVTGVLTAGGTIDPAGNTAALAATVSGGVLTRLAALRGDGSALGGPLVYERPHVDGQGWRMLAAPLTDTFAALNDDFHTQGAVGADYPFGGPNLFAYDPTLAFGSRYVPVPDYAGSFAAGRGYFFYAYGTDPGTGLPALPTTWDVEGLEPGGTVSAPLTYGTGDAEAAWNLLGNPYAAPIDWHAAQAAGTFQAAYAVWDPAANGGLGNYAFYNAAGVATGRAGRYIPQAQGFWAATSASSPSLLVYDRAWKEVDSLGVYVGRPADGVVQLRLRLQGEGLEATEPVAMFIAQGAVGYDLFDGTWIRPLSTDYAALFFVRNGDGARLIFEARPTEPVPPSLALAVETTRGGTYTLSWPTLDLAPPGPITLLDAVTGETVDLRTTPSYTFTVEATEAPLAPGALPPVVGRGTAAPHNVTFGTLTAGAPTAPPTALVLEAPAPNPLRGGAVRLRYGLPASGAARVAVYDALGREVAVVQTGAQAAGWHEATLDAGQLAPGVYVIRLEAGGAVEITRLTVAR